MYANQHELKKQPERAQRSRATTKIVLTIEATEKHREDQPQKLPQSTQRGAKANQGKLTTDTEENQTVFYR